MTSQKTALITGANKGIGLETAKELARKGFHVFLTARDEKAGLQAAESVQKSGGKATFSRLDVSEPASIQNAAKEFRKAADHLDVLVNNAGIFQDHNKPLLETDIDTVHRTFDTNTLGPILVMQAFYPFLQKSGSARVINVSSGLGSLAEMGTYAPAYSISKTALNAVTRQFALLLKDQNITVNSVCPGWVRTDMGGPNATRSLEQGADTIVWLATEAPRNLSGRFLRDRKTIEW